MRVRVRVKVRVRVRVRERVRVRVRLEDEAGQDEDCRTSGADVLEQNPLQRKQDFVKNGVPALHEHRCFRRIRYLAKVGDNFCRVWRVRV